MSWLDGLLKNWAELDPKASDADLRPVVLSISPQEAIAFAADWLPERPRWKVSSFDIAGKKMHATHTTRFWRFVDDVHVQFEPHGEGTRIVARSQSRVGKGDFGQNSRNLRELVQFFKREGVMCPL